MILISCGYLFAPAIQRETRPMSLEETMRPLSGTNSTAFIDQQQAIKDKCFHPTGVFIEFKKEDVVQSISNRFEQQVHMHGNRVAVKTQNHVLTYTDLDIAPNRIASSCDILNNTGVQHPQLFDNKHAFPVTSQDCLHPQKHHYARHYGFLHSGYPSRPQQLCGRLPDGGSRNGSLPDGPIRLSIYPPDPGHDPRSAARNKFST